MTITNITSSALDYGTLFSYYAKWAGDTIKFSVPGYISPGVHSTSHWASSYSLPNEPLEPEFATLSESLGQVYAVYNALTIWGSYITPHLSFVTDETTDGVTGSVGDIRVAFAQEGSGYGIAYSPPPLNTAPIPSNGDIWIDDAHTNESLTQGTYNFQGLLHESGHALGLQHVFADGSPLASYVSGLNLENYNLWQYSVMSYTKGDDRKSFSIDSRFDNGAPRSVGSLSNPVVDLTPMVLDIQAIQDLYGKNLTTGSGNDTYRFVDTDFDGRRSLYDAAGNDTLDFSAISRGSHIDLRPGAYSDIAYFSLEDQKAAAVAILGVGQQQFVSNTLNNSPTSYQWTNNFGIAFATVIENVIGTAKADTIIGNTAANVITGGAGADTISGGGGADIFRDTAANLNGDTITDFINSNTIHVTNAAGPLQNLSYTGTTLSFALPGAPATTYTMTVIGATGAVQQKTDASGGVDIFFGTGALPSATYSISTTATSLLEGNYGKENSLVYTVSRTSATGAASVDVLFSGTAQSLARVGRDFTAVGTVTTIDPKTVNAAVPTPVVTATLDANNRLYFAPGALTATFTVTTVGDYTQESNESIITTIANATDGTIGTAASVKVNIIDDDGPGAIAGKVIDGYIVGATVFADANGNGILDPGEESTVTDAQGAFGLANAVGPIIAIGGTDSSTGLAVPNVMKAPAGSSVITPLTTIAQALAASGVTDAVAATLAAFGLPASFDLTHTDPFDASEAGLPGGLDAIRAGAMVADTLQLIAAGLQGSGASVSAANASALSSLASYVASNGVTDLTHTDVVTSIASSTGLSSVVASTIGSVAAVHATALAAYANAEDTSLGALQLAAQRDVTSAIVAAGSDPTKLATIVATANLPPGPAATFSFALTAAHFDFSNGRAVMTAPDGTVTDLTGVATITFTDGTVQEKDGSPLVDDLFYDARNPDVWRAQIDPDQHYAQTGWHEGRDPNALFSTSGYLAANLDVKAAGVNPLTHYDQNGWHEGRSPGSTFSAAEYLTLNPDVARNGVDPLRHYLEFGQAEKRTTALPDLTIANGGDHLYGAFDATYYLANNADVALAAQGDSGSADRFAYMHFLTYGAHEGRNPDAYFSTSAYLTANPDVAADGINPLLHYEQFGWQEGRDPSSAFHTNAYLAANPDVGIAHIDPLVHYLQFGLAEGRLLG